MGVALNADRRSEAPNTVFIVLGTFDWSVEDLALDSEKKPECVASEVIT
jgi:hypothetical protein